MIQVSGRHACWAARNTLAALGPRDGGPGAQTADTADQYLGRLSDFLRDLSAGIEDHDPADNCRVSAVEPGTDQNDSACQYEPQSEERRPSIVQPQRFLAAAGGGDELIDPRVS